MSQKSEIPSILVVDDDPLAGPLLKAALRRGFSVQTESSGALAISAASNLLPHAILLDLHMPNIDGYEVLRKLKNDPKTSSIPVICMSGATDQASRDRAIELGAASYFQKPLDMKRIGDDITALLTSLNTVLSSSSKTLNFTIAFNHAEKYRLMSSELRARAERGEKCIVISLLNGDDFVDEELRPHLLNDQIYFMQISPSLIAKFPYLQDLSPLTEDLQGLVPDHPLKDCSVFFDDPQLILGRAPSSYGLGKFHGIKALFQTTFLESHFYSSRESGPVDQEACNELAVLLCR